MATSLELDTLVGYVKLDATNFLAGEKAVRQGLDDMEARMASFAANVTAAGMGVGAALSAAIGGVIATQSQITQTATSVGQLAVVVERLSNTAPNLAALDTAFATFSATLKKTGQDMDTSTVQVSQALARVGRFFEAVSVLPTKKLGRIGNPLSDFLDEFKITSQANVDASLTAAAQALGRIGTFLDAAKRFKYDPTQMSGIGTSVTSTLQALASAPGDQAANNAMALVRLSKALGTFAATDPKPTLEAAKIIVQAVKMLNSVPAGGLPQIALTLTRIANAMKAINAQAATGAGGPSGPGGFFSGLARAMTWFPSSARQVTAANDHVARSMQGTKSYVGDLVGSLLTLRNVLVGYGYFAVRSFTELDTALLRASAHTRDFSQQNRPAYRAATLEASNRSGINAADVAKGLDVLAASGMSAGMAIKALATAEDLAVASGMSVEDSARKLTQSTNSMGLAVENVTDHYNGLNKMADLIVGVSRRVGADESAMFEGFTAKFSSAVRRAKMSVEDAVVVLGLMARSGSGMHGRSQGGNITAKAISEIVNQSMVNREQWKNILKFDVRDSAGQMLPMVDVIEKMSARLHQVGVDAFEADMALLGFGKDAIMAIEPLLSAAGGARELRDSMNKMKGTAHEVAEMIRNGFGSQMSRLWQGFTNVASVVMERLAPALLTVTKPLTDVFNWFTELNIGLQNFAVVAAVAGTAVMALAVYSLRPLVGYAMGAALAITALGYSLARYAVVTTFTLLGAAVMSAVRAFRSVNNWSQVFTDVGKGVWSATKATAVFLRDLGVMTAKVVAFGTAGVVFGTIALAASAVATAVGVVYYSIVGLGKAFQFAYDAASWLYNLNVWKLAGQAIDLVTSSIVNATKGLANFIISLGSSLPAVITSVLALVMNLAAGLIGLVVTAGIAAVVMPVVFGAIAAIAGTAAGVVVTLGLAVYKLAQLVGVGLVAAWNAMGVAAVSAAGAAWRWISLIAERMGGVWDDIKGSLGGFVAAVREGILPLAGFLWNWQKNLAIIFDWLKVNGEQAFKDIATAAVAFANASLVNIRQAFLFIGDVIVVAMTTAWKTVTNYWRGASQWIGEQWKNIVADMSTVWQNFITTLSHNIEVMIVMFQRLRSNMQAQWEEGLNWQEAFTSKADKEANAARWSRSRTLIIKEELGKLQSPFDALKGSDFKTDFKALNGKMEVAGWVTSNDWENAGFAIAKAFSERVAGGSPLMAAFRVFTDNPIWSALVKSFDTKLPDDALGKMIESYKALIKPVGFSEETGQAAGGYKMGGTQFKQISTERFMFDGKAAESLERQKLKELQLIRKDVGIIATQRGQLDRKADPVKPTLLKMPVVVEE